jgi:hypothetical protein
MADAATIGAAIAAALAPTLAALAPIPPIVPPPPAPVAFSRTPAQAYTALLNYKETGDAKLYNKNVEALPTVFSLATPNVMVLLAELRNRSRSASWATLLAFAINGINMSFIQHYGRISMPDLKTHVDTFIDLGQCQAQTDFQLYMCLHNSVDSETREVMEVERSTYLAGAGGDTESGLLYLKKLLMTAEVDNRATTSHARDNLGALDVYMSGLAGCDVVAFNKYVRRQLQTLTARGETTQDLVNNLFKGYLCVKSKDFNEFIKRKRNSYREGEVDYTPESLMVAAANQYSTLQLEGVWDQVSEEQKIITALKATVSELTAAAKNTKPVVKRAKNNEKKEFNRKPSERFTGKMAWKAVPPKTGETHNKNVRKITYYWCPHHGFWTAHKPEDCTLGHSDAKDTSPSGATPKAPRKFTFAEAATALVEEDFEDDEEEE